MPEPDKNLTPGQEGDAVAVYLADITALERGATRGPWTLETDRSDDETADDHPWPYAIVMPEPTHVPADRSLQDFDYQYTEVAEMTLATAEFVVGARSAVPRLLGAVEAVRAIHVPEQPVRKEFCRAHHAEVVASCGSLADRAALARSLGPCDDCEWLPVCCRGCREVCPCATARAITAELTGKDGTDEH